MRYLLPALLATFVLLAGSACLSISQLQYGVTPTPEPQDRADRTDCGEILGTAFRSDAERAWFTENCSAWAQSTLGETALPGTAGAPAQGGGATSAQPAEPPECAQIRGRPYESQQQRQWFLANCVPTPAPAPGQPGANQAGAGQPGQQAGPGQPAQPAPNPAATPAPQNPPANPQVDSTRQACERMRVSGFRTQDELMWYYRNCR